MCKYFRNLSDYCWICCLFLLTACCDVAVSLSRQCVLADVGIKCSFPLISTVALDVSIGTSSVSKQTLLFKVPLVIAAFHSVSFIYLSAFTVLDRMSVFVDALLCPKQPAVSRERKTLLCHFLRVARVQSFLQHSCGAVACLLPATLPAIFSSRSLWEAPMFSPVLMLPGLLPRTTQNCFLYS